MPDLAPEPLSWLDDHLGPGEERSTRDERRWTRWLNRDRQRLVVGQPGPKPQAAGARGRRDGPVAGDMGGCSAT
ncbi:MAG: hypothetical protein ACYDAN_00415 [Candidatus Limnocylindrales bacterium]